MGGRRYVLEEVTWQTVQATKYDVAVLPWGATEAHNVHLPYGTDTIQCRHVAEESARLATEAGTNVMVLPAIPVGVQSGQLDIPLCLHVNPSTQLALLRDLTGALAGQGIDRLAIINGHGGNDFRALIRELQPTTDVFLCTLNWWQCADAAAFFDVPGDHAGELETSTMLHLAPDLVLPLDEAGTGAERRFRIAGLREGWVWAPRQWTEVTTDTGVGDPRAATADRGERFFRATTTRIAGFLEDLARADLTDLYG